MNIALAVWIATVLYFSHADFTDEDIAGLLVARGIKAETTVRGIVVYIPQVTFESGQFQMTDLSRAAIKGVVDTLLLNNVSHKFAYFEGHTDHFGTDEDNLALGQERAEAVKNAFESEGLSSRRTGAVSYGESLPVSSIPRENRRVNILLLDKR